MGNFTSKKCFLKEVRTGKGQGKGKGEPRYSSKLLVVVHHLLWGSRTGGKEWRGRLFLFLGGGGAKIPNL